MINFKDKTIILAVPNHFGLPEVFKKNLEFLGFKVFLLHHDNCKGKLTAGKSIIHFFRKNFRKEKTFKARLVAKQKEGLQLEFLKSIDKADFGLVIRPDLFSSKVLEKLREKTDCSSAYQWDGMSRFPLVKNTIQYFDNFFVFDKSDTLDFPGTKNTDNFYFDYLAESKEIIWDVFFVGTFMKDRIIELIKLSEAFEKIGLKSNINVIYTKERHITYLQQSPINFTKKGMNFLQNIEQAKSSLIILDFQNSCHKGLSFRTFEAIGYGKKLITNNPLVREYDFYNENNILVIEDNLSDLKDFIKKKYIPLSIEIIEKYSFSKWIERIFYCDENLV